MRPSDERMRELISLRAFGLSEIDAVRYYVAMKMAENGLISAPNVAVGEPFNIGFTGAMPPGVAALGIPAAASAPPSAAAPAAPRAGPVPPAGPPAEPPSIHVSYPADGPTGP